jgi:hypothetical protein
MSVETALQEVQEALDVERSEAKTRLENAEMAQNRKPYRTELQGDRPCCNCGVIIPRDKATVCCHLPLHLGGLLTSQFITWCDKCWQEHYGFVKDAVEDRVIDGG